MDNPTMKSEKNTLRPPLGRSEWIDAATAALAAKGADGVRVEVLAKGFGVTKGSFYWHFKDRQDLVDAVLARWKEGRIGDIDRQSKAIAGHERDQLRQIIKLYGTNRNRRGIAIELAIRDWARRDTQVAAVVATVDQYRLAGASRLFKLCGFSDAEAKSRSLLLYAYVFGQSLMAEENSDAQAPELRQWIIERIVAN